ncbi:MAG: 23S rRNA (uracil(1939)-C(5))-methyltransferase RlmD [Candidatus Eisenbacteria bacterium]|uniref:23S rRNA (Uracil(1939)-C(5))-methyltransferase RlmD n=1 Tax=Eiseniibacteriota bacterium TaxID=2212470 RepID=A0A538T957_UNCEI|nr:MAG: 23S rRNA (uracil(1939)-C(5))-methyltransferase RlmD [Candidatus Eisenbacteria bacterium]
MKVNDLLNVWVEDLALGGAGLARHAGRVVFVDRGLPGDRLDARITRVKRGYAEAKLDRLETPSGLRVAAPCTHVAICGGCRFQELAYPAQCEAKTRQVRDTLIHLGGVSDPSVHPIAPAPAVFGYRNKMEFSFHPDPADGRPVLGLHVRNAFDRVFALERCELCSALTNDVVRLTQRFAVEHRWRAYDPRLHQGVVRFLTVRHLPHTDQCGVHLVAAAEDIPGLDSWARAVADLSPAVRTVTLALNRSHTNVAFGEQETALVGNGTISERLLGLEFEAGLNVFLQTNSAQAEALYQAAIDAAALAASDTVLDLYCGTGTLTLLLARRAREAIGVESVTHAVSGARRNARRNGIGNARFVEGDARRVLREWARAERPDPPRPEVVVVDPPRAGLHARVVARVAELEPRRIVYVSCNPATLARDVRDFASRGFVLVEVRPFDMFPHTPHIECVAALERAR